MAIEAPAFRGLIHPDDSVFYPPGGMAARVARHTQGEPGTRAEESAGALFRRVYESLAMQYRWALSSIETLLDRRFSAISLVGGGSRDEVLCQFTADATGLPVMAGPKDASAVGNVLVQMLAREDIKDVAQGREIVRRSFPLSEYLPRDTARWEEPYARFLRWAHPEDKTGA